jgi:hypothetical protein
MASDVRELLSAGNPEGTVEGWKQIALVLDIHVNTAQLYARRRKDPLPVYVNHRGPIAFVSGLREWERRQVLPYQVHLRERETDGRRTRRSSELSEVERPRRRVARTTDAATSRPIPDRNRSSA